MYLLSAIIYYTELRRHYLTIVEVKERGVWVEKVYNMRFMTHFCSNPIHTHYNVHLWMTFKAQSNPLFLYSTDCMHHNNNNYKNKNKMEPSKARYHRCLVF